MFDFLLAIFDKQVKVTTDISLYCSISFYNDFQNLSMRCFDIF